MIKLGLLGAGRIGMTHARAIQKIAQAQISAVFEPLDQAAAAAVALTGARRTTMEEITSSAEISGVIIATPTDLHAEQIKTMARAGKTIFCEKPIALNTHRIRECLQVVEQSGVRLMVGFNRRFDPDFARLKAEIECGGIGSVELIQITSRDPAAPPLEYIRHSGGLFRDMMIHDFDMACFLLDEEVSAVCATGSALTDPAIAEVGDIDTATATLRTATGKIVVITNSRRASYGYDQRIEVHGSLGMLQVDNHHVNNVTHASAAGFTCDPLQNFFMQRYAEAYHRELEAFVDLVAGISGNIPSGIDGLRAMELADAAFESMHTGQFMTPGQEPVRE